jgi:hypothetical protein
MTPGAHSRPARVDDAAHSPSDDDPAVLIVVVNAPADLIRARDEGWYRIPLARAPARIGAEYLAFYLTGAFPPDERWGVRWLAPVRGYTIATRRELIPTEPDHPHGGQLYYRVSLGPLEALPRPIPSRRLRRITFIPTTLTRLQTAVEINDLWVKSSQQERLWTALKQAGIEAERQYPLADDYLNDDHLTDDAPGCVADFALPDARVAVIIEDEPCDNHSLREEKPADYRLSAGNWRAIRITRMELTDEGIARVIAECRSAAR